MKEKMLSYITISIYLTSVSMVCILSIPSGCMLCCATTCYPYSNDHVTKSVFRQKTYKGHCLSLNDRCLPIQNIFTAAFMLGTQLSDDVIELLGCGPVVRMVHET